MKPKKARGIPTIPLSMTLFQKRALGVSTYIMNAPELQTIMARRYRAKKRFTGLLRPCLTVINSKGP